jgi:hypothetical protein
VRSLTRVTETSLSGSLKDAILGAIEEYLLDKIRDCPKRKILRFMNMNEVTRAEEVHNSTSIR